MKRRRTVLALAVTVSGGCLEWRRVGHADEEELDEPPTTPWRNVDPGTIEIVVDGDEIDLSDDRFRTDQTEVDSVTVHLDGRSGTWKSAGDGPVTIAEGIDQLPGLAYERDGWRRVAIGGTTYDERDDGTETAFFVDGAIVDPEGYELRDGDSILIAIRTDGVVAHEDPSGRVNETGTLAILVDGEHFDLTQDRFQAEYADDEAPNSTPRRVRRLVRGRGAPGDVRGGDQSTSAYVVCSGRGLSRPADRFGRIRRTRSWNGTRVFR